jgi:hypothetical protein
LPEGPSGTGALSFGSFLWANKENEQKKNLLLIESHFSLPLPLGAGFK